MFFHNSGLQFEAKPDGPDAAYARKMQEIVGGAWGEITVALQYLFQGWNCTRTSGSRRSSRSRPKAWTPRRYRPRSRRARRTRTSTTGT